MIGFLCITMLAILLAVDLFDKVRSPWELGGNVPEGRAMSVRMSEVENSLTRVFYPEITTSGSRTFRLPVNRLYGKTCAGLIWK